jgi:hypothetical protein
VAPPKLALQLHSLPPILHRQCPNSMPSCSKAPRGLFVLLRVRRIFTPISISPGPSLRQCSSCYTVRAGRNLPDKEFRYLRTVIVTAAVHRGFGSEREPLSLTFRHWAGVSPYTSPFGFAETCGFVNQSLEPFHCDPPTLDMNIFHEGGHPLSLSYGAMLPNSLTKVLPFALVFSTHLPVSDCGTDVRVSMLRGFSRQRGSTTSALEARTRVSAQLADLPTSLNAYTLPPTQPIVGWPTLLRPLIAPLERFRNVDRMSIAYALRPRLRPD